MSRALVPLIAACLAALAGIVAISGACTGTGDDDDDVVACQSPLDCELGESCRDGTCTADSAAEGEGEGEEPVGEEQAIAAVCQRLAACQATSPETCVNDLTFQLQDIRARGSDVCLRAADAMVEFFSCATGLTCEQLQSDPFSFCPVGQEANNLQNQCVNLGEGEGESECFVDQDCPDGTVCIDGRCIRSGG